VLEWDLVRLHGVEVKLGHRDYPPVRPFQLYVQSDNDKKKKTTDKYLLLYNLSLRFKMSGICHRLWNEGGTYFP
jgi:hypothetical protein